MKIKQILLIALLVLTSQSSTTIENTIKTDTTQTKTLMCNQDLLKSFNLKGYVKPKVMFVEMCGDVNLSCCQKEDLL